MFLRLSLNQVEQFLPGMYFQCCINCLAVCRYGVIGQSQSLGNALCAYAPDEKAHYIGLARCQTVLFSQASADGICISSFGRVGGYRVLGLFLRPRKQGQHK